MKLKKMLSFVLAVVIIFTTMPAITLPAKAATVLYYSGTTGKCNWEIKGTELIISGNGAMADYTAYSDKNEAPWGHAIDTITKITINSGVTHIGTGSFDDAKLLTSVTIPETVGSIGSKAFCSCSSLKEIVLPSNITRISYLTFAFCRSLENINIPVNVTYIDQSAFESCTSLEGIFLTGKVRTIGHSAFEGCTSLKSIYIPSSVTSIGSNAFYNCKSLLSADLPSTIKKIDEYVFYNCSSLARVSIPNTVTSIESYAFYGCEALTEVVIPDSVTSIGTYAFYNCKSLTNVTLPSKITDIKSNTFRGCSSLTQINIPENVTAIGDYAFYNCSSLENINIPSKVTSIGKYAFLYCSAAKEVYIPASVSTIGSQAFTYCGSLESITVAEENTYYYTQDNCLIEKASDILVLGCKTSIIPETITVIGDYAFCGCDSLTEFTVPNTVLTIGNSAFKDCIGLTQIAIPNGVTSIGSSAFYGCISATEITIPSSVKSIGSIGFRGCESLEKINIPDSVNIIEASLFNDCSSLTEVTLPNSITQINDYAFQGCTSLAEITIPTGVTNLGNYIFKDCSNLTDVNIPEGVTVIGWSAFENCSSLKEITIPTSVTTINFSAFNLCKSLTKVEILGNISKIDSSTFYGCASLTDITIPDGVASIGYNAFDGCTSLKEVTIPFSVTSISPYAFEECDSLTDVWYYGTSADRQNISVSSSGNESFINATWHYLYCETEHTYSSDCDTTCENCEWVRTEIGEHTYENELDSICDYCGNVRIITGTTGDCIWTLDGTTLTISGSGYMDSYTASKTAPWGTNITKVIIDKDVIFIGSRAFAGCASLTEVTISNGVKYIYDSSFIDCTSLSQIEIPDSVTYIGYAAFKGCSSLNSVNIPDSVTSLGQYAFNGCSLLTNVSLSNSIKKIESYTFKNCSSLKSIDIPSGVTEIGQYAFEKCSALTNITLPDTLTSMGDCVFYDCKALTEVIIPDSVISLGETVFVNCNSLKKVVLPSKITSIGYMMFFSCYLLSDINIPDTVISIEDASFCQCMSIEKLTIPSNVETIGKSAFSNCQFKEITLPKSVSSIGDSAFEGCNKLKDVWYGGSQYDRNNISFSNYNDKLTSATWHYNSCENEHVYLNDCDESCEKCEWIRTEVNDHVYTNEYDATCNICGAERGVSGITGDCTWTLVGTNLAISGEGYMASDYDVVSNPAPWGREITKVLINDGVKGIANYAFISCESLTEVSIPNSVTYIGEYGFGGCSSLTQIDIPDSVTDIDSDAFRSCSSLTQIDIPDSVINIGDCVFESCSSLIDVNLGNNVQNLGTHLFANCSSLTKISIPSSVKRIETSTFNGCTSLTEVILPNSITSIGGAAFAYCTSLQKITIPDSVKTIYSNAFLNCSSLAKITIGKNVSSIYSNAFRGCCNLENIVVSEENNNFYSYNNCLIDKNENELKLGCKNSLIPSDVTSIGQYAFDSCTSLTEIILPKSIAKVSECAFFGCASLTDVWYIGSVSDRENISVLSGNDVLFNATWHYDTCEGEHTYFGDCDEDCSNCEWTRPAEKAHRFEWIIDQEVTCLEDGYKHEECSVCHLKQNENTVIKAKGSHTYSASWDLTCDECEAVRDASGTTGDVNWALSGTTLTISGMGKMKDYSMVEVVPWGKNITKIIINKGVTSIGGRTFLSIDTLEEVVIADTVTNIGEAAFAYCDSLKKITIPSNVKTIGDWAFEGCSSLEFIELPYGLTKLNYALFDGCSNLKTVIIPDTVTTVDHWVFNNCTSLTEVAMSENITVIGSGMFSGCTALEKITIPASVTNIPQEMFVACTSLKEVTIQNKLTSIGEYAFHSCKALTDIWYVGNEGDRNKISVAEYNDKLLSATWHYNICSTHSYTNNTDNSCNVCGVIRNISGTSGQCTWYLMGTTLIISGNGNMLSYSATSAPWGKAITEVIILDGVTSIGNYAFYGCSNLNKVTIPDSVTSIGAVAFYGCSSLTEIKIPNGVTSIKSGTFEGCTSLKNITIPDSVTQIGNNAFSNCSSLTEITIPESVTAIGGFTFYKCRSLSKVNVLGRLASIGDSAFYYCDALTEISIPSGVAYISRYAFYSCSALTEINLTADATYIGDSAFRSCGSLKKINVPDSVEYIGIDTFYGCTSLTEINIPKKITAISDGAFRSCHSLTKIDIKENVTSIGNSAFNTCKSLTEINLSSNITAIGEYAFYGCEAVTKIDLPSTVTAIGTSAFYGCRSLTEFTIPSGVTVIADYTFFNCPNLKKINIPNGVTSFGNFAFYQCTSLTEVNIPNAVTSIGERAFDSCSALKDVWYTGTLEDKGKITIGAYNTGLNNATWHYSYKNDTLTFLVSNGEAILTGCSADANGNITIPNTIADATVTTISDNAFKDCSNVTRINIPSSVNFIGDNVFVGCSSLERFEVAEDNQNYCSLNGILYTKDKKEIICTPENQVLVLTVNYTYATGETAFESIVRELKAGDSYNIPVPEIEWHSVSTDDVSGIMSNVDLTIDVIYYENAKINSGKCNDNITWTLYADGSLIFRGTGTMPDFESGNAPWHSDALKINAVYIDPRIESIGAYAFEDLSLLTFIDYGYSISSVGKYAFSGCASLKSFKLPETVTEIKEGAFYGCTGLKSVVISEEVTYIGDNAFYGCNELVMVTVGANVTHIGNNAFDGCEKLTQIYFRGKPATLGETAFGSFSGKYVYYYSTVEGWDEVIEDGLWGGYTAIPYNAISKENFNGTNVYIIKVVDKHNMPLSNAVVTLGENVQSTNQDGMAYFIKPLTAQNLSVSCSDHITFSDSAFRASTTQLIDIIELSDRPSVVQGVRVNDDSIATSVKVINCSSDEIIDIAVSGYSKYKVVKYELYQANRLIATKKTNELNCTFSVKASAFEEEETVLVKMHTSDGYSVASALNIDVIKLATISENQIIDEFSNLEFAFSFGSMGNYKIPLSFTPTGEEKFYTYISGRTIRVGINLDIGDYFKKNGEDAPKSALQKMVDQAMKTYKKPKNTIEYNLCGYIEIEYLGNGEYYVKTNYVKMAVAAKLSFSGQASFLGIVGVYFKTEVSGESTLDIKISRFEPEEGFDIEDLNFAMEDTLTLEGGAYLLWGIGSAGLYGKGKLGFVLGIIPEVEFESVYISGEFGAKWSLLWGLWSGKKVIASGDIYRWSDAQTYMMRMLSTSLYEAQQNPDSYEVSSRDYLNYRSEWTNGEYLQKNIYDNVAPKIVNIGEEKIMVWLDDNSQRSTSDFQTLYYSVYKNGVWSEPIPVCDNGTFDCEFDLYSDGEKVYVIYTEKTNKNDGLETLDIGDEESVSSFIKDVEVSVAVYENGSFSNPMQITDNSQCEILPQISEVDGEITVVWVQSNAMGIDGYTTDNTVSYSVLGEDGWSNPVKQFNSKNSVSDINRLSLKGNSYTVYITDSDGNNETKDDLILVLSDKNGNSVQLDEGLIGNVGSAVINGETVLTWYNNGKIYMLAEPDGEPICLLPEEVIASTNYQFVSVGENSTMLTFIMSNYDKQGSSSKGTDIYGVYVDEKGYLTTPVRLTDTSGYVVNYSVSFSDNKLITVFTETFAEVLGDDVQTVTHLRNEEIEFNTDISLDGVDYNIGDVKADTEFELALNVSNDGTKDIDGVKVNIYDVNGELVYTADCDAFVKTGDTHTFLVSAVIPKAVYALDYTIEVLPLNSGFETADSKLFNNKLNVNFAFADFEIIAEQKIIGEKNYLIISVSNEGNIPTDAKIVLFASDINGEKLSEIETGIIENGTAQQYMVELSSLINDQESVAVVVESKVYDPFTINNAETLTLLKIDNDAFTGDPEQIIHNPEISVNAVTFDKYTSKDVSVEITKEAENFIGIEGLTLNEDYSFADNSVVILSNYLMSLKEGKYTLNLVFDFGYDEPTVRTLSVTVKDTTPAELVGNVDISGEAVVGNTVYADISILNCNANQLTYRWTFEDEVVSTQNSYEISIEDYGKILKLTVTGINGVVGELSKEVAVTKRKPNAPSVPIINKVESNAFDVIKTEGVEYSIDLISWQDSNVFSALLPNTTYTVYARIKATDEAFASEVSNGTTVTTLKTYTKTPIAPTAAQITDTSVTLTDNDGYEYSMDGISWQEENLFENLAPNREYTFYQRIAETDTSYVSEKSEALTVVTLKTAVKAPKAPEIKEISYECIELMAVDGCEYSIDGINWQKETVFKGLTPDTEYTFYQRMAETDTAYASQPSECLTVKTKKIPEFIFGDVNGDNKVDTIDLAAMKLYLAALNELSEAGMFAGDMNNDAKVDTTDLAVLKLKLAGLC